MDDKYSCGHDNGKNDPFPIDLAIGIMSLATSLFSLALTIHQIGNKNKTETVKKEILKAALDLHNLIDDLTLILGRTAPELEQKHLRFAKASINLSWRDFRRYDEVENKLSTILSKVRGLASDLRQAIIADGMMDNTEHYFDQITNQIDELFDSFSTMTFSDFSQLLRKILDDLERWLMHKNG